MTQPPCYNDGEDCQRRMFDCKINCPEWREWEAIHARETQQIRQNKYGGVDADAFLADQNKRARQARRREYMREQNKRR